MRLTTVLAAAALVASGLAATAPRAAHALTETTDILVTNQYGGSTCGTTNQQIQIANATTGDLVRDLGTPSTAFQIPNDAKPFDLNRKVVALWGGDSTMTGSTGIGVYDRTTNTWGAPIPLTGFERGANGPHSIAALPDGYFAVALVGQLNGAGSGFVAVVSPTGTVTDTEALSSAHGVEYDGSRSAVFAIGMDDVRKYTYSTVTHTLLQVGTPYDLPGTAPGGHDLRRRRTDNKYFVTTNSQVYVFDPEASTFTVQTMPANEQSGVKSMDIRFDGLIEYSKYQTNNFRFTSAPSVTAKFCLSGYKHGRWIYAPGEKVYNEDTAAPAPTPTASGIGWGFPMDDVAEVEANGADLAYGSFWEGYWVNTSGWGGLDGWLDKAIANNVTPVIQWYYWGDDIDVSCYQTSCAGKTKSNWDTLAGQLRDHIWTKMRGREVIVVLESEWAKHGMDNQSTFDGWLRNQMTILRSNTSQPIKIALGWPFWVSSTALTTYAPSAAASDYSGTMILYSCLQDRGGYTNYNNSVQQVIDNATNLHTRFGKPVLIDDFGLSSYSGASSNDSTYSQYSSYDRDCQVAGNYENYQRDRYTEVFTRKMELASAGVMGFVFRAYRDAANSDTSGQFHRIAERWWGIVRGSNPTVYKAAFNPTMDGIRNDSGAAPGPQPDPTPQPGGTDEWRQEAEAFTTKPVGGQCTDAAASGGLCWNVWSNGTISTSLTAATAGTKTLKVIARGDPAGGVWPQMKVRVDGVEVMNLAVSNDHWSPYAAALVLTAGSHNLEVELTNDAIVNGDDRNLLVDVATLDVASRSWFKEIDTFATKTQGAATPSTTASGGTYWNLWSNGYVEDTMTVPYTSQHDIQVSARGSSLAGVWPIMKVYVDGVVVLTQTVNTSTWVTYDVRRTISGGNHTLRIEFTNDAQSPTEDRNLHLDTAALYS